MVRHQGVRKETRAGGDLIVVVVKGARGGNSAGTSPAGWSPSGRPSWPQHTRNLGTRGRFSTGRISRPGPDTHRAEIVAEADTIAGREVQKVALRWPGRAGTTQTDTVWFDPESLLPVRQRTEAPDGTGIEAMIDYPSAKAVAGDLFTFNMPRDAVLEVDDSELGRQLYSEGQARKAGPSLRLTPKERNDKVWVERGCRGWSWPGWPSRPARRSGQAWRTATRPRPARSRSSSPARPGGSGAWRSRLVQLALSLSRPVDDAVDRIWLDRDHGWAVRQREQTKDGQVVARWEHSGLREVEPGLWLPTVVRHERFAEDAPAEWRGKPVVTEELRVKSIEVNKVLDDRFDMVPKKGDVIEDLSGMF